LTTLCLRCRGYIAPAANTAMAQEDEAWNNTVKEWLIDEGYCYAGGVASKAEGTFYGAAAAEGEKWSQVIKDARNEELVLSDTEKKEVWVDETQVLWYLGNEGRAGTYPGGVWLAGQKYTLVREQELEVEGNKVTVIFCSKTKGGACIACSKQSIVVGFNDENKGQQGGNCQKAVLAMVGYLNGDGGEE